MGDVPYETRPELWGGIECTVNRIGDTYFDQLERNGHAERLGDLEQIAGLGITALRYPVLWERMAPVERAPIDWSWSDARLPRLRELGVNPIVGLVHHGSGPRYTDLTQPGFAQGLANYARAVAERYPWVDSYTPVNEPLTTARFSGLYGHWYPHNRDAADFARVFLNQVRAVNLAMREIRKVNPHARLVQTDDLGKTHSSAMLAYQAELENERRWLTFDLLTGKLIPGMPMWTYLTGVGVSDAELNWFVENPCPPDIVGINHYLTSERYLDERLHLFPQESHGGNGTHRFADIEAVRVADIELVGIAGLLREAWERYRLPLAITELHLGCTREEQLRWFVSGWNAARQAHADSVDVRAVTAWSMFGAFDWNSLVTNHANFYEPGVFDVYHGELRPTAIAQLIRDLAEDASALHPAVEGEGWWQRPDRWRFPLGHPSIAAGSDGIASSAFGGQHVVSIVEDAASWSLMAELCRMRGLPHSVVSPEELTSSDAGQALDEARAWAFVSGFTPFGASTTARDVSTAAVERAVDQLQTLGRYCAEREKSLLVLSLDAETGSSSANAAPAAFPAPVEPGPLEQRVLQTMPGALIVRSNMASTYLDASRPVPTADVLNPALDLLIDGASGVWHLERPGG